MKTNTLLTRRIILSATLMSLFLLPQAASAQGHQPHFNPSPRHWHGHLWNSTSTNWSGYATLTSLTNPQSGSVTQASGNWTIPTATCNATDSYSAAWTGLDGYSDTTVEQIGTEQDCTNGRPVYYAWYEMYPQYSHTLRLNIHPGDEMQASVTSEGWYFYSLNLKDLTTGQGYRTNAISFGAQDQSAEWIVEAPTSESGVLPLAKLSPVTFTSAHATVDGVPGSISSPSRVDDPITLTDMNGNPIATPGPLTAGGTSFTMHF